jgi:hypothetical protein
MGNAIHGGKKLLKSNELKSDNTKEDDLNLILVNKGIRSAYLWYERSSIERITPPNLIHFPNIKQKKLKYLNSTLYYLKTNIEIDNILEKKQILENLGKILGYIYPMGEAIDGKYHLPEEEQYWIIFKYNTIILWAEAAPKDADLNKFGDRLKEIQTLGKIGEYDFSISKLIIEFKHLTWDNKY